MKIKVISADTARHEILRRLLAALDETAELSGAVGNPEQLESAINGSAPDILVVDGAPGRTLEAVERLGLQRPGIDTVVLSDDASPDFFLQAMRAGVREVVPAARAAVLLPAALQRIGQKRGGNGRDGKVLAFVPCKGGSGATFVAANLAYALAEGGKRVALIDLNLQFGDAALFLSAHPPASSVAEVAQQFHRLDAALLASAMQEVRAGLSVLAAPEDPAQATEVRREHVEGIVKQARGNHDVVILDVSHALDPISLQALDMADIILPVLQQTLPFVRGARHFLQVFRSLDYPDSKVRLIVNRHEKSADITLKDLEQALGSPVFRAIPNSYAAVARSVNLGEPIVKGQPANPVSKALLDLGQALLPTPQRISAGGWLTRVFGRR